MQRAMQLNDSCDPMMWFTTTGRSGVALVPNHFNHRSGDVTGIRMVLDHVVVL